MSKCPEFFEMYKKYGSACLSTNIDPKKIDAHIQIAEDIAKKFRIELDFVYLRMPMSATNHLMRYKPDSEIRLRVIELIADKIKNQMKVTSEQVREWLYHEGKPIPSKYVPNGNAAKLGSLTIDEIKPQNIPSNSEIKIAQDIKNDFKKPEGVKIKDVVFSDNLSKTASAVRSGDVKTRKQSLVNALTSGQMKILYDVMEKYDLDDEITAISKVLIWAKERMDNE